MGFRIGMNTDEIPLPPPITPIPAGEYVAHIVQNEEKVSKTGNKYYSFVFEVIDGPHKGRKLFSNFNVYHEKAEVSARAQSDLAVMARACGKKDVEDADELNYIPVIIKVVIVPNNQSPGEYQNAIRSYRSTRTESNEPTNGTPVVPPGNQGPNAPVVSNEIKKRDPKKPAWGQD